MVFTEKGSCRSLAHKCMLTNIMCGPCLHHDSFSDRTLRTLCDEGSEKKDGVCLILHASERDERMLARDANEEEGSQPTQRTKRKQRSRSAPPAPPIGNPTIKPPGRRKKKGRLTEEGDGFRATVKKFREGLEVKNVGAVEKGILQILAGTDKICINPTGASKATKSRENTTAGALLNGVASLASKETSHVYRDKIVKNAYKKAPTLAAPLATSDASAAHSIANKKVTAKMHSVNQAVLDNYCSVIKDDLTTPKARRPYIALFAGTDGVTRPMAEKMIGYLINEFEWKKARLHAKWPGALKQTPKVKAFRQRVSTLKLQRLLHHLEAPGNLQRYAYGTKLLQLAEGTDASATVNIDKVDRLKKTIDLTVEYIMSLEADMMDGFGEEEIQEEERCACRERDTYRRCRLKDKHQGKHKFTGKGSLSVTAVRNLVKTLTGDDIKRLSGLDDTKVLKGRENFNRMRRLSEEICNNVTQRKEFISRIDDCEVYYLTDFQNHLQRDGDQKCHCLTCGFCEEDDAAAGIECANRQTHKNCCVKCTESYGIIEDLRTEFMLQQAAIVALGGSALERQEDQELSRDLDRAGEDLTEYRSHLARHQAEQDFDALELNDLQDDTAVIVSDFKMKILSCFFRENQLKWFGKRGTSCLGFMIISNSTCSEARRQGIKEVKFIMTMTDAALQDEQCVASAKHEVYTKHLVPKITKVSFHSDGAGCFKAVGVPQSCSTSLDSLDWY